MSSASLSELLDWLAVAGPSVGEWRGWRYLPVTGGANNRIVRVTSASQDLAIKWTIRDARDRAGREYAALTALRGAGLKLAPAPIWLERERYPEPVVVQSWLAGEPLTAPPARDAEWRALLEHLLTIHTVTPSSSPQPLAPAVLSMHSAADGLGRFEQQLESIPPAERPAELLRLADRLERQSWPTWPEPPLALCRVDPNVRNFICTPGGLASVDWENSGWGDPAFELADLLTHPSYAEVPSARQEWLIGEWCEARAEPWAGPRIRTYRALMLAWWAVRLARSLYEVPLGGDQRLAARPADWHKRTRAQYQRYLALAWAALER